MTGTASRSALLALLVLVAAPWIGAQGFPVNDDSLFARKLALAEYYDLAFEVIARARQAAVNPDDHESLDALLCEIRVAETLATACPATRRRLLSECIEACQSFVKVYGRSTRLRMPRVTVVELLDEVARTFRGGGGNDAHQRREQDLRERREMVERAEAFRLAAVQEIEAAGASSEDEKAELRSLRFLEGQLAYMKPSLHSDPAGADARACLNSAAEAFQSFMIAYPNDLLTLEASRAVAAIDAAAGRCGEAGSALEQAWTRISERLTADPSSMSDLPLRNLAARIVLDRAKLMLTAAKAGDDIQKFLSSVDRRVPWLLENSAERDLVVAQAALAARHGKEGIAGLVKAARAGGELGLEADRRLLAIVKDSSDWAHLPGDALDGAARAAFERRTAEGYSLCIRLGEARLASIVAAASSEDTRAIAAGAWYRTGLCRWRQGEEKGAADAFGEGYRNVEKAGRNAALREPISRAWLATLRTLADEAPDDAARRAAYDEARRTVLKSFGPQRPTRQSGAGVTAFPLMGDIGR